MLVQSEQLTWASAMGLPQDDTTRLILLDLASPLRRTIRSFMDDTRCPVASHGHAVNSSGILEDVASRQQHCYKADKMAITAQGFSRTRPIPLQGGLVQYTDRHTSLGNTVAAAPTGIDHLTVITKRSKQRLVQFITYCECAGLSMAVLLLALDARFMPEVCHGIELVMHYPNAPKLLNALQASWLHQIIGLQNKMPRVVLMVDLGVLDRLSAYGWIRALKLRERIRADNRYSKEEAIFRAASHEPGTWAAALEDMETRLGLGQVVSFPPAATKFVRRERMKQHSRNVIIPAVAEEERRCWLETAENNRHWLNYERSGWTVYHLSQQGCSYSDLCSWARPKLQGHFTVDQEGEHSGPHPSCRLCDAMTPETSMHLFNECPAAKPVVAKLSGSMLQRHQPPGISDLASVALGGAVDAQLAADWAALAGKLARRARRRQSRAAECAKKRESQSDRLASGRDGAVGRCGGASAETSTDSGASQ